MAKFKAKVVAIGAINPNTGKGDHSWSVYDIYNNKGSEIYYVNSDQFLLCKTRCFEIGDEILLIHNKTNQKIRKCIVLDKCDVEKSQVLQLLKKHGKDYYPKPPFIKAEPKFDIRMRTTYIVVNAEEIVGEPDKNWMTNSERQRTAYVKQQKKLTSEIKKSELKQIIKEMITELNPDIMKQAGFGKEVEMVNKGICPFCHKKINLSDFKDELSKKEFKISGLCQKCQDSVFNDLDENIGRSNRKYRYIK